MAFKPRRSRDPGMTSSREHQQDNEMSPRKVGFTHHVDGRISFYFPDWQHPHGTVVRCCNNCKAQKCPDGFRKGYLTNCSDNCGDGYEFDEIKFMNPS
jgi:hypothetical protein